MPHQQRLELYVSRDALKQVTEIIPMLVSLGEHFWPDVPPPKLRVYDAGAPIAPAAPFFVIGDPQWQPRAWVHFDEGRVRLRSNATGEQQQADRRNDDDQGGRHAGTSSTSSRRRWLMTEVTPSPRIETP